MYKKIIATSLFVLFLFSFSLSALAASNVMITSSCQVVDRLDGVPAYYRPGTVQADATNTTYSCAAYAKRYFSSRYGVTLSNLNYNSVPTVSRGRLIVVATPQKGDLAFFKGLPHSAIVKSFSGSTATLIE